MDFARPYGYRCKSYEKHGVTGWEYEREETCYDTETDEILHCDRAWYEENQDDPCWPDDERFRFCTVDEFISLIIGEDEPEIDLNGMDSLL